MISELLELEKDAITAITQYMTRELNARLEHVYEAPARRAKANRPHITKKVEAFWKDCLTGFRSYSDNFTDRPNFVAENTEFVSWYDYFDDFEQCYNDIKDIYGFGGIEGAEFDKLFKNLYRKMVAAAKNLEEPRKINFGVRLELKYLPQMLDTSNSSVCELLPYLLTSYVFNSWDSRFFYKNSTAGPLIPMIFESSEIPSVEASKIRERIKAFANIFSLKSHASELMPPLVSARPSVYLRDTDMDEKRGIRYRIILDEVFRLWCTLVTDSASKYDIKNISKELCTTHSQTLYEYYVNQKTE